MRKLVTILWFAVALVALFAQDVIVIRHKPVAAGGSWGAVIQHPTDLTCSTTACAITVASTGTGHAIVVFLAVATAGGSTQAVYSSITGGGTYAEGVGCRSLQVRSGYDLHTLCGYTTASTSGATTITFNYTEASSIFAAYISVAEFAWSGSTIAFDTSGSATRTACTSCTGVTLTLSGSSDLIVQDIIPDVGASAISGGAGYTAFADFPSSGTKGFAAAINTTNGAAPSWTATSGVASVSAIALKGS